ncbi:MAG: hypothetical protein HQK81_00040 [Desulfovibrionaceae bacterium]|nr:hypothetical protein [Desulfovibrionaceae bacterium]MBF0512437.1 hypothetical protein [Desulfovibrionaceae bacterium]
MSDEIEVTVELKKPLDKMTAKELRDVIINQMPMIAGASAMGKDELVAKIKEVLGITGEGPKVSPYKAQICSIKAKAKELRAKKVELAASGSRGDVEILRRKINKLKKRTRRLAAV